MEKNPNRDSDPLRFCFIARIQCLAGSLDEPQLIR